MNKMKKGKKGGDVDFFIVAGDRTTWTSGGWDFLRQPIRNRLKTRSSIRDSSFWWRIDLGSSFLFFFISFHLLLSSSTDHQ